MPPVNPPPVRKKPRSAKPSKGAGQAPTRSKKTAPASPVVRRRWWAWPLRLCLLALVILSVLLVFLDAQVRHHFDGRKWNIAAKVYARPLLLYPGLTLSAEQLRAELQWADYREQRGTPTPGTFEYSNDVWRIHRRAFSFWDGAEGHARITMQLSKGVVQSLWVGATEQPMVRLEPQYIGGIFPQHNEDRELVTLDQVPPLLVAALIVTEDKSFLTHSGISLRGIARAFLANVQAGGVVQGGSTLTQQLVKNFYLSSDRTLVRKGQEALMAVLLELHYSKSDILQAYLNEVYLGQAGRRSIHGFGLAARFYFGKSVADLSTAEMATLVGLVKGASFYNPRRHPERAKERRDLVLSLLAAEGIISDAERRTAQAEPLVTADAQRAGQREYPAFLAFAKRQLQQDYRLHDLQNEGLLIFTTLDPWIQHALEASTQQHLQALEQQNPMLRNELESAAVVTSVDGGEVRAMLGSRRAEFFGFNRALDARRPLGSLVKPAVFLTALQSGNYHWGTPISDDPVYVAGVADDLWQPRNFDRRHHGDVPMVSVLARSLNASTVRLGMNVGLAPIAKTIKDLGLVSSVPAYPSLLLGAIDVSPLAVATFYQTIAAQGFYTPLRTIESVATSEGQVLSSYAIRGEQRFQASDMQWLRYGLQEVVEQGTAQRLRPHLPGPVAIKTGTSDGQRDAWVAGFDQHYSTVIWVGRDDNSPMPFAGSRAALPIWQGLYQRIGVQPLPDFTEMDWLPVDTNGQVYAAGCTGTVYPFSQQRLPSVQSCKGARHSSEEKKRSWFDWLF